METSWLACKTLTGAESPPLVQTSLPRLAHAIRMQHLGRVPKNLQVRDVPDRLHGELKRRARASGRSLTDYVQDILEREVARPPAEQVFERIRSRPIVDLDRAAADLVREERAAARPRKTKDRRC
ncbi:MAG: hypothetical protein ABR599_09945 [Gemmatimonadota bacterium]